MLAEIERFVNWVRRRSNGTHTWKNYVSDLRLFVKSVGDLWKQECLCKGVHAKGVRKRGA